MSRPAALREEANAITGEELLRTFAELTHTMHAAETHAQHAEQRAKRDLVQAEILRRMEPPPVRHHLRIGMRPAGYRWTCSCGREGKAYKPTKIEAKRLWQSHVPKGD